MDDVPPKAVIEGHTGVLVGAEGDALVWQVEVPASELMAFLGACVGGRTLDVRTDGGVYRALARRWWVTPRGERLEVRVALEERVSA